MIADAAEIPSKERLVAPGIREDDARFDRLCRPGSLDEYIGQEKHKSNLKVFVEAARRRGEPLDHVLLCGPPGLGKTTLAFILANEMGVQVHSTSGPAIEHKGALAGHLTRLEDRDVLFIDEIHRLTASVEETLYPAIESFQLDVMMGDGPHAATIQIALRPFTLVGATTRTGLLTSPLLSRFGYIVRLDFYPVQELMQIVKRSAKLLGIAVNDEGAEAIAQRSRGTPRVANRLLRRVSDFALVLGNGKVDEVIAKESCGRHPGGRHGGAAGYHRRRLRTLPAPAGILGENPARPHRDAQGVRTPGNPSPRREGDAAPAGILVLASRQMVPTQAEPAPAPGPRSESGGGSDSAHFVHWADSRGYAGAGT
jgi:Holliday junction DNA helicase RuvB